MNNWGKIYLWTNCCWSHSIWLLVFLWNEVRGVHNANSHNLMDGGNFWNREKRRHSHSCFRYNIQLSQQLKTALILCFLHSLQITLSSPPCDNFTCLETSLGILATWPYQAPWGCSRVSGFGISTQWDLEIGNERLVFKIFFSIKTKYLGFAIDEYHFATQCKYICHILLPRTQLIK